MHEIERENQRLLQKLSQIMSVNRLENYWKDPHPNFLNRVYIKTPPSKRRAQSVLPAPPKKSIISSKTAPNEPNPRKSMKTSRSCMRCPTCSGKPITANVVNDKKNIYRFSITICHPKSLCVMIATDNTRGTCTICTTT